MIKTVLIFPALHHVCDMGISDSMNTGSPERLAMLRARIREAEEERERASAAGDGLEACRQTGNIAVWKHAIHREFKDEQ